MTILKCLDISTQAVTQHDIELLNNQWTKENPIFAYPYEFGAFITGPDFSERDSDELVNREREMKEFGYSDKMLKLLNYCRKHNIHMIRIDVEGDPSEDLEEE